MDDSREPATKQDVADVRTEMQAMEDRLIEAIRDGQTELLKAFYSVTESNNKRLSQSEANELADRGRIEALERRVTELEKRLNLPPAA